MVQQLDQSVKTPCVGICSTGIGDSVCRGCKRYAHEVIHWNGYTESQKRVIDSRLTQFLSQIVETKLRVLNPELLKWHLEAQQIPHSSHKGPYVWAYELLRAGAGQIRNLENYGIELDAEYRELDLKDLRQTIDAEFYILSEAHYQRYFRINPAAEASSLVVALEEV